MPYKEYYSDRLQMLCKGAISESGFTLQQKWKDAEIGGRFLTKLSLGAQEIHGFLKPSNKYLGGGEVFIPFGPLNSEPLKKKYKKSKKVLILQKALLSNEEALSFSRIAHLNQRPLKMKRIFFLVRQKGYDIEINNGIFTTLDLSRRENDRERDEECIGIPADIRAQGVSLHMEETFGIKVGPGSVDDFS